jgi:hypothetical protein
MATAYDPCSTSASRPDHPSANKPTSAYKSLHFYHEIMKIVLFCSNMIDKSIHSSNLGTTLHGEVGILRHVVGNSSACSLE